MSLKGNSGFRWTPPGSNTQDSLRLNWPMHLVPQGGLKAARRKRRYKAEDITQKQETVLTVGSVQEIEATIRFAQQPTKLADMLADAGDGATIEYTTDMGSTAAGTNLWLEGVGEVERLRADQDRFAQGEYQVNVRWRSTQGGDLSGLF